MAKAELVESLTGGLDSGIKRALKNIFTYVLANLRLGRPDHRVRAENLQAYFVEGTTSSTANTEFSIAHGLATTPYLAIQVLDLRTENAQLVPLKVSKSADGVRIYLKSSSTSAPITLLVEAP